MTEPIADYAERLAGGEALSESEILAVATTVDILTLGMLADKARRRKHGAVTTFVRVAEVPVPIADGPLEIPPSAGEVRIVGAPGTLVAALAVIRRVVGSAGGVPVSAFSLQDFVRLAERERTPLADVLKTLRDGGLELVGDAALDDLPDPVRAFSELTDAGLQVARVTLSRSAPVPTRLKLLDLASTLQRDVGGIPSLAPLPQSWDPATPTTGYEDVRFIACSRLLLDRVPSIQVDWSRYGPKLAQVALTFGADDVDGVSPAEGAELGPRRAALEEIRRNIRAASLDPVERNGRYQLLGR